MWQKTLNLVKERGRYELFCVGGLYGRSTKTILDFEVKFFGCCSIEFGIQSLVGAPNGFNIRVLFLLFLFFLPCSFAFGVSKTFVVFQCVLPMKKRKNQFGYKTWKILENVVCRLVFGVKWFDHHNLSHAKTNVTYSHNKILII